ncbi:MAG: acetyl-CoA carboxyl transferase [Variovorax sp.]|nr:acetyl-CoA carboxyl transferase [Variovorax sp.]
MSIFNRPHYTSEITQFIDEMKRQKPDLEAQQRAGRAIWWDKKVDRAIQTEFREGRLPQRSYAYQTGSLD